MRRGSSRLNDLYSQCESMLPENIHGNKYENVATNSLDIREISNQKSTRDLKTLETAQIKGDNYSKTLIANFKTAIMLFIVTLVMVVVYTPALLTSFAIIDYNPIHWNIIYINNAANPIIYSFMNKNFRKKLKKIKFSRN